MITKLALPVLCAVFVFAPAYAGAMTPTVAGGLTGDQIDAIVSLLTSFGADGATIARVEGALGRTGTPPTMGCIVLERNLASGASGADVKQLQTDLIARGYLASGFATGYYGSLTSAAVGRFQIATGVVRSSSDAGYGSAGPRTRAAIGCGMPPPPPTVGATLQARPNAGAAPLAVAMTGSGLTRGGRYVVEFGDGSNSGPVTAVAPEVSCMSLDCADIGLVTVSHTYATAGVYTATLEPYVACLWSDPRCMIAVHELAQVTVTVAP
jgi:hypothetical protein